MTSPIRRAVPASMLAAVLILAGAGETSAQVL